MRARNYFHIRLLRKKEKKTARRSILFAYVRVSNPFRYIRYETCTRTPPKKGGKNQTKLQQTRVKRVLVFFCVLACYEYMMYI